MRQLRQIMWRKVRGEVGMRMDIWHMATVDAMHAARFAKLEDLMKTSGMQHLRHAFWRMVKGDVGMRLDIWRMAWTHAVHDAHKAHLKSLMKSSGMTYEAEEILNGLQAGTGPLAETEDVRSMLVDAQADISKNRFDIRKSQQKAVVESFIKKQFDMTYQTVALKGEDAVMGPDFESFRAMINQLDTVSVEDENKYASQYAEAWNKARKEGASLLD